MTAQLRKCDRCWIKKRGRCPILKAEPSTTGCTYDEDIMVQIIRGMRSSSRPFEDVAKELGI